MQRLLYVISFTSDIELSKRFYRDGLGLTVGTDTPFWVDFAGDGAGLALLAMSRARSARSSCASRPRTSRRR